MEASFKKNLVQPEYLCSLTHFEVFRGSYCIFKNKFWYSSEKTQFINKVITCFQGLIDSNEKRACNFNSDCTVGKILCVGKNSDKCLGGAKWKPFNLPVNTTLVLVGVLGECF